MDAEPEKMIEVFTDWLNKHHEANDEDHRVSRDDFDEILPPRILADNAVTYDYRVITLFADPYHDEGGPNILTGFFSFDDGVRYGDDQENEDPKWILDAMVQYFDTQHSLIYRDGDFEPSSLPS